MADYAISNVPRRVVYAPSGVGPYAFTFEILNQTDIAVYKASTLLTLTTDYTVTINANGTGSVTLVATAGTSNITIVGAKNIQRTTDFTTGGDLFANTLNDELDNQTIFIQQVAETAERGLKAPVVDPTDINMTLPAKASRVGTVLAFNATTGNPEAGPSIGSVTTVAAQSANINTVATNIADVNAVADNETNINTVAGIAADVTMVATFQFNVNTVADDLNEPTSEINTVAVDIANVNAVGTNISNVNAVAGNSTNINAVVSNATNINAVAGNATNINAVNSNSTNINTVATNIANVNNVGNNIANVNQVAADTAVINSASANAASASNSAIAAASSASSASASAAAASAVVLGNEPVRPTVRPSLLLDFANTKQLDPRITFSRPTTARYYDEKSTVVAEQNLVLNSQGIGGTSWTNSNVTITANSVAAPNGTTTASTITGSSSSSNTKFTYINGSIAGTAGTFTTSIYAKAGTQTLLQIFYGGSDGVPFANFDLSAGTLGSFNGTASITAVGSGWYRCTHTYTFSVSNQTPVFTLIDTSTAARGASSTSTGSLYLWGAQLEQRSTVTAYTATTTAAITNYIPVLLTQQANESRFDHNPVTRESLGLLIEEQRTNLLTYSDDFSNAAWTKAQSTITSNTIVAPDGTLTGDKLVENTATAAHAVQRTGITITSGISYTLSVYAKAAERTLIQLQYFDGTTNRFPIFSLVDGTKVVDNGIGTNFTSTNVGNGWWRFTMTMTSASTAAQVFIYPALVNTNSYAGQEFSGIYIWGAQLEAGAFATSYIPTVASQVTRSADSASMTGANFSSWYNQAEGTWYGETPSIFRVNSGGYDYPRLLNNSTTTATPLAIRFDGAGVAFNSATLLATSNTVAAGTTIKLASSYSNAGFTMNTNAGTVATTTALMTVYSGIVIGRTNGLDNYINGCIKKLAYYPARVTNAQLQGVTTV